LLACLDHQGYYSFHIRPFDDVLDAEARANEVILELCPWNAGGVAADIHSRTNQACLSAGTDDGSHLHTDNKHFVKHFPEFVDGLMKIIIGASPALVVTHGLPAATAVKAAAVATPVCSGDDDGMSTLSNGSILLTKVRVAHPSSFRHALPTHADGSALTGQGHHYGHIKSFGRPRTKPFRQAVRLPRTRRKNTSPGRGRRPRTGPPAPP
jgi:hypothetical protein